MCYNPFVLYNSYQLQNIYFSSFICYQFMCVFIFTCSIINLLYICMFVVQTHFSLFLLFSSVHYFSQHHFNHMIHEDNYITFKCIYQLSQKYKFEKINIFLVMIIKDGSYKQIETRGRQTIAYNIFVKSKHSCRQMRKFNHMRSNRKCLIYKLILNILSYRENEILDFPPLPS